MPIELAGIQLNRIHQIETLEQGNFIHHRVPGSQGNITQNIGRDSVCLKLQGIFYGPKAQESLESLRKVYQQRKAVDFLADIVGQSYFSQVILDRFEVLQSSRDPEQFSYSLTITEHVPPPRPAPSTAAVNTAIKADAANFLTIATLPDVLKMGAMPEVSNPIEPLGSALTPVQDATKNLDAASAGLKALFNF